MCGIVGYIGENPERNLLYKLRLLEYRGYDSAGIAVSRGTSGAPSENNPLAVTKRAGELKNLENAVAQAGVTAGARLGIGHTRWATHGKPDATNAHPHVSSDGKWAVVHNGIIENHCELKRFLQNEGYSFYSETDTETIAKLLEYFEKRGFAPLQAIKRACDVLQGSFALAVLHENDDAIYFAKNKSPLYLAFSKRSNKKTATVQQADADAEAEGDLFIASDVVCFNDFAEEYYALPDKTYGFATAEKAEFYDGTGEIRLSSEKINAKSLCLRNNYAHYMLKEIYDTKNAIKEETDYFKTHLTRENYPLLFQPRAFKKIILTGCGTAYHAALTGARIIEEKCGADCEVYVGSEFYNAGYKLNKHALVVLISQSGETADTLAALTFAKEKGAATLAMINAEHSTLAKAADMALPVNAGAEIAVASTKAYSCQLVALYALAQTFQAAERQLPRPDLSGADELVKRLSYGDEEELRSFATLFGEGKKLFFIGRGTDYFTALEASLKIKETSYINADVYYAGELKHGFLALVDENAYVTAFATQKDTFLKTLSNAKEAQARGAKIILFTTASQEETKPYENSFFRILRVPKTDDALQSVQNVLPWQLIAYFLSVSKGLNPDKPRNLAKSVTVE
ncbi:MAG: glutamine--fructose-6-phosphate transaminase (isomerizing) [Candidatus Borkfalkiaceae bacterium]|nr:glutamine--fructose-6-phosphate transaminase (isomerizing) [Clostridia bacterium]MDY6223819.1 glutamine--fructose-6-phosphate transaminase (isomerizing) [Christensenellaceae bacterium]